MQKLWLLNLKIVEIIKVCIFEKKKIFYLILQHNGHILNRKFYYVQNFQLFDGLCRFLMLFKMIDY